MPRVSSLASRAVYGVITPETVDTMFTRRLLAADLLSHAKSREVSHAATMVRMTLEAVRTELMELIV